MKDQATVGDMKFRKLVSVCTLYGPQGQPDSLHPKFDLEPPGACRRDVGSRGRRSYAAGKMPEAALVSWSDHAEKLLPRMDRRRQILSSPSNFFHILKCRALSGHTSMWHRWRPKHQVRRRRHLGQVSEMGSRAVSVGARSRARHVSAR